MTDYLEQLQFTVASAIAPDNQKTRSIRKWAAAGSAEWRAVAGIFSCLRF
jgi:hypothetical protein